MSETVINAKPEARHAPPDSKNGARIEIQGVSHAFSKNGQSAPVVALDDVDLEIPAGQFVAFVGPSGCGKTTLLNMIAGLLHPLVGTIRVNDDTIDGPSRHTSFMFARDGLLPWRTALQNVELGLEIRHMSRRDRATRAREVLALVGLADFETSFPHQLSQGMRQRVAIARTLATEPDTVLMDEPFAALDAQTKIRIQSEFIRIWEGSGQTVVFVTHDLSEAILLADRVITFAPRPGRIVDDIQIDLPRPRNIEELRFDPRYVDTYAALWDTLKKASDEDE
jgi:NitT/TauT family transport system ATP-binding protein